MGITSTQKKEANVVEIEIAVSASELSEAINKVYRSKGKSISVPGFRKGKAPKSIIERMYGEDIFLEDAVGELYPKAYGEAVEEAGIEPVDRADIEILSADRENGLTFKATVTVKPQVEVGEYKGIAVTKTIYRVEDSEVEAEISAMRERGARIISVEDRPAKEGDTVSIDFEGFVDDVAFEGGKAAGHKLELGSNSFIDGFEAQIAGHNIGEEFDVNVTFPEEYHAENLKGKPALFKVKLHEIKEKQLPDLDDEFAKDVSEFDSMDALRADIREKIQSAKDARADSEMETRMVDAITATVSGEIPPVMFEDKIGDLAQEFSYRVQSQAGMSMETYLQYSGMDMQAFREGFREQAERQVKMHLALEAIAVKESLAATEEEVEAEYAKLVDAYKIKLEKAKEAIGEKEIRADIACNKVIDLIKKHAKVTEVEEEKAPAGEEKTKAKPKTKKAAKAETEEETAKPKAKKAAKAETEEEAKPKAKKASAKKEEAEEPKKKAPRKTATKAKSSTAEEGEK